MCPKDRRWRVDEQDVKMSLDFSRHPKDLDEVLSHLNAGETQNNDGDRVGDTYRALERLFNYYNRLSSKLTRQNRRFDVSLVLVAIAN